MVLFNPFNHRGRTIFIFSRCWVSWKKSYKKSQYCQMSLHLVVILWKEWSSKFDLGFLFDIWHSFGFSSHLSWGLMSDALVDWKNHRSLRWLFVVLTSKLPPTRLFRAKTCRVTQTATPTAHNYLFKMMTYHSDLPGITIETYTIKT